MVFDLDPSLSIERNLEDTYLDSVFGKVHPDNLYENDPYNFNAFFRCRLCESRQVSYYDLRNHLKTCNGSKELWANYLQTKCEIQQNNCDILYLPESETKLELSSSKGATHFSITDENDNICTVVEGEEGIDENKPKSCHSKTCSDQHFVLSSSILQIPPQAETVVTKKRKGRKATAKIVAEIQPVINPISFSRATEAVCQKSATLVVEDEAVKSPERLLRQNAKKSTYYEESILDIILVGRKSGPKPRMRRESTDNRLCEGNESNNKSLAMSVPTESPSNTTPVDRSRTAGVPCKHCTERPARRSMIHHVRSKHPELTFVCSGCFSGFVSSHDFSQHKKKCSATNVAKMLRRRSFTRSRSAKRMKSDVAPLKCVHCGEEFMNSSIGRSILLKHVKEQHHAKFVCRWCFYDTDNFEIGKLHKCNGPSLLHSSSPDDRYDQVSQPQEDQRLSNGQKQRSPLRIIQVASSHSRGTQLSFEKKAFELNYTFASLADNQFIKQFMNRELDKFECPFCPHKSSARAPERFKHHFTAVHPLQSMAKQNRQSTDTGKQARGVELSGSLGKGRGNSGAEANSVSSKDNFFLHLHEKVSISEISGSRRRSSRLDKSESDFDATGLEIQSQASSSIGLVGLCSDQGNEIEKKDEKVITPQKIDPNGDIIATVFRDTIDASKFDANVTTNSKSSCSRNRENRHSVSNTRHDENKSSFTPLLIDTNFRSSADMKCFGGQSTPSFPVLNNEMRALLSNSKLALVLEKSKVHYSDSKLSSRSLRLKNSPNVTSIAASRPQRHSSVLTEKDDPRTSAVTRSKIKTETSSCPFKECQFTGPNTKIMTHMVRQHNQKNFCHFCFKCFNTNKLLQNHLESAHDETVPKKKQNRTGAKRAKSGKGIKN